VLAVDLRGTGTSTPAASRASRYGYAELVDDVGAVLDLPDVKRRRVFLVGHSLGGQICALHLALGGGGAVEGLILVAVGLPYFRSYGRQGLGVFAFTQTIAATSAVLGVWPGWSFGGRQARGVIRDWGYTARHGRFPHLHGVDVDAALRTFRTPVFAASVDDDQYTPSPTVDYLVAKFDAAPVRRLHYATPEAGGPLDHFRWTRAAGPLVARIREFIDTP
jgi:predicted alpha/beta hydrolase